MIKRLLLILSISGLTACMGPLYLDTPYERPRLQTSQEIASAKTALTGVQSRSFEENREYCGYIGLNASGAYIMSPPKRGRKSWCQPQDPGGDFQILASYHTHGGWSKSFDSEVPSTIDLSADIEEKTDGYIATPGGRLWFNDAKKGISTLVCSAGCLKQDARYVPDTDIPIRPRYTLEGLRARERDMN